MLRLTSTRVLASASSRQKVPAVTSASLLSRTSRGLTNGSTRCTVAAAAATTARGDDSSSSSSWSNPLWTAAAVLVTLGSIATSSPDEVECCGIMGVVSTQHAAPNDSTNDARALLLEGLAVLRNRGYDSAGMATASDNGLMVSKYASRGSNNDSFELLEEHSKNHAGHRVGIAHTRWATHGGKTDQNAHPHTDYTGRIALVHNGTVNNAHVLRTQLEDQGIVFKSETDTEVIAHMVGLEMDSDPSMDLKSALAKTVAQLDGTWGLAVIANDKPEELVVACNGSPLVIGMGTDHIYVASETAAFNRHTKNFIAMQDGEIAVITPTECSLDKARIELAPDHGVESSPAPHAHWTLYEALQQPMAIARALAFGGRMTDNSKVVLGGLDRNADKLATIRNLMFAACGTSLYASQYGAKLIRDLGAVDSCSAHDAAELRVQDIPKSHGGIIAVSQSGETRDTLKALKAAEMMGIPRLSVVNVVGSAIARETKMGVYLNAGRETAVASTKAFTTQVTVLALIALWFRQVREGEASSPDDIIDMHVMDKTKLLEDLQRLPISFGMAMSVRAKCQKVAKRLHKKSHCFVLGKGYGEPVAMEGALKLKEMAYIHAEGYSGGALKHGPFALIEGEDGENGSTPVIMLILDDEHAHQMRTAGMEVKARGADVIVITDKPALAEGLDSDPIVIPSNDRLTALIGVLPLQLIAYELALLKGINPDTPRNLAKAVTTD
ncbi:unnamed protein product [Pylaiella littoralis]